MRFLEKWLGKRLDAAADQLFTPDPACITALLPKVLWIELTSKCPYDCIFCSRNARFGSGRHMDFELYKSIIRDLESPDVIRLNYSGESLYHPRLLEAIELAAGTGAVTELVTAFSSISPQLLKGLVESRLGRLAVSLHTMDGNQYQQIYRFSSLDQLKQRIDEFLVLRRAKGSDSPGLDFCFVALRQNLAQLSRVAAYAKEVGVHEIFIHPIIGRHVIPFEFPQELAGTKLVDSFKAHLRNAVAQAQAQYPEIALTILNADIEPNPSLSHVPRYFGPALPPGARIHSCDQNPWETVHILAGGDIVVCEVHDEISLGNLHRQTLREIWQGERYAEFRKNYSAGSISLCRQCPWKTAYLPTAWKSVFHAAEGASPQLLRGWYAEEKNDIVWSKRESLAVLKNIPRGRRIRIAGILPHSLKTGRNVLEVGCNGASLGRITNRGGSFLSFDSRFAVNQPSAPLLYLKFATQVLFRPSATGLSSDTRDLGFALSRVEVLRM